MATRTLANIHEATIVSNAQVAQTFWRMVFKAPALAANLASGQFISIEIQNDPWQLARIPLAYVSCDFDQGTVEVLYAPVGEGTRKLTRFIPGDTTTVLGPGGHGWELNAFTKRCLLVAGGCGVAPIASAAQNLGLQGLDFDAVVGAKTATALWGIDRLMAYGADHVIITTDDGSVGAKGFPTDVLDAALPQETYDLVLACGPEPMLKGVAEKCATYNVACQVSLERTMTCGFGACMTCAVDTKNGKRGACMHGPVFKASEVIWK